MSTLIQHTTTTGRWYEAPDGTKYPSVTTVLGATLDAGKAKALADWRKRVGAQEADRIRNEASARGNAMHKAIEDWFNDPFRDPANPPTNTAWLRSIAPAVKLVAEPVLVEARVHHGLGFAGSVDMVARGHRGQLAVIDWKTSNSDRGRKPRAWIADYELQVAAYTHAINERMGLDVQLAAVAIAYDDGGPADVFWLDAARLKLMWGGFVARLRQYQAENKMPWETAHAYEGITTDTTYYAGPSAPGEG